MAVTDQLGIEYADGTDSADVPATTQALAEDVEGLLLANPAGFSAGDLKWSVRDDDFDRWLKLDGRELTQAEIETALALDAGQAADLVALLGTGSGSLYGAAASGKVKLADSRRSMLMNAGPSGDGPGGLTARALGATGGTETVTLTGQQSGMPTHTHGVTDPGHTHTASQSAHSHTTNASTTGVDSPGHVHGLATALNTSTGGSAQRVTGSGSAETTATPISQHTHSIPALGMNSAQPAVTVNSDQTDITINNASAVDAAQSHNNMPPFVTLGWAFIRV